MNHNYFTLVFCFSSSWIPSGYTVKGQLKWPMAWWPQHPLFSNVAGTVFTHKLQSRVTQHSLIKKKKKTAKVSAFLSLQCHSHLPSPLPQCCAAWNTQVEPILEHLISTKNSCAAVMPITAKPLFTILVENNKPKEPLAFKPGVVLISKH